LKESAFRQPATRHDDNGALRTVGFEIEFTELSLEASVSALESAYHCERRVETAASCELDVEGLGRFTVEIDWEFLKRQAEDAGEKPAEDWVSLLSQAAEHVVPVEVVCPPVDLDSLDRLLPLTDCLRHAGARGTANSVLSAYGVHINARSPALDSHTLWNYLRAFGLLQWWLVEAHEVDFTRRASTYIDLYPEAYLRAIFTQDAPDMARLMDDYLRHNPTRNRALDMLPLLSEIDSDRVQSSIADRRIKSRPTFHYRLPNCQIDREDWSLASSWNLWCCVDDLAQQPEALDALAERYRDEHRVLLGVNRSDWVGFMDAWLRDRGLV
jgi:hypothetical protein